LLLLGEEGVVRSEVCVGPVLDAQYMLFLEGAAEDLKGEGREWLIALDMDNKIHTTEEMTQVRNLIRNDRVHLFFIPPNSYQMSAIEWLLPRLKQMVARRTYESTGELREAIQDSLRQIPLEMIQTCLRESEEYLTRGINSINF
jgi:transposase